MSEPTLATEAAAMSPADLVSAALNGNSDTGGEVAPSTTSTATGSNSGGHPAWQEILGSVPEVLHERIRPTLEKWDKGVQERLEEYTQKLQPFQPFIEGGTSVEELHAGHQLMQFLNNDPQKFYESMAQHYGFGTSGQGETSQADTVDLAEFGDQDISNHPEFKKLAEGQQKVLAAMQAQQQQEEARQAEEWLTTKQNGITESFKASGLTPDFDYILNKAMTISQKNGGNYDKALDQAAADYQKLVEGVRGPVATLNAPPVMTPNGSVPVQGSSEIKSLAKDDKTRKSLLAQALNQALNG